MKHGVHFATGISNGERGNMLFEAFAESIEQTGNTLTISQLPGWLNGKYINKDNFAFRHCRYFAQTPVMKSSLTSTDGGLTSAVINSYSSNILKWKRWQDRCVVALYPFMGIMSSLLSEGLGIRPFLLNVILIAPVDIHKICNYFKVLNRKRIELFNGSVSPRELTAKLSEIQDDIVLVDFRSPSNESSYEKCKRARNFQDIILKASEGNISTGADNSFGIVALSKKMSVDERVWDLRIDYETYSEECVEEGNKDLDALGIVFAEFIKYVEQNFTDVNGVIRRPTEYTLNLASLLAIVFEITKAFWESKGCDLFMMADLPQITDWEEFVESRYDNDSDLEDAFVKAVRNGVKDTVFLHKSEGIFFEKAIQYSEEFVWIPTAILREILEGQGLLNNMSEILLMLRESGALLTDAAGMSRKLQVAGHRNEYYQFKADLFDQPGHISFIKLGKEL